MANPTCAVLHPPVRLWLMPTELFDRNSFRPLAAIFAALLFAALSASAAPASRPAAASVTRPSPAPAANCNQPAKDPISLVELPGHPFEPIVTRDGCWLFVSMVSPDPVFERGVAVLHREGGTVKLVRVVRMEPGPAGMVMTHDGRLLIATDLNSVAYLDTERLISGHGNPLLGHVVDGKQAGSVYVNVSPDDRYVFVSDENIHSITVIDLARARRTGFNQKAIVGKIPTGLAPIALTFSRDGRYLFTTSEVADPGWGWPGVCTPEVPAPNRPGLKRPEGAILVIDVKKAESDPAHSVIHRIPAGCSPVRLVLSPRGDVAYVTVRHNNELAAFDTARLLSDPAHARIATVPVGAAPVGVAVVDGGRKIVVTNSNRFAGNAGDHQPLTVIDASKISQGAGAVLGTIPAGAFPRELRVTADGRTLLVTNFQSSTLQLVDLERLPLDRSQPRRKP